MEPFDIAIKQKFGHISKNPCFYYYTHHSLGHSTISQEEGDVVWKKVPHLVKIQAWIIPRIPWCASGTIFTDPHPTQQFLLTLPNMNKATSYTVAFGRFGFKKHVLWWVWKLLLLLFLCFGRVEVFLSGTFLKFIQIGVIYLVICNYV